jgi:4-carboxymuconolactone decarboxylase
VLLESLFSTQIIDFIRKFLIYCKFLPFPLLIVTYRDSAEPQYIISHHQHTSLQNFTMSDPATSVVEAHKKIFDEGIKVRYEVAGKEYVDRSLANGSSDFARPMQELVTEACWSSIWTRPGLEKKYRSLLNIAMLCALNRETELAVHVRGAVNNGASEVEIRETLLQAAIYCGMPAGIGGFKVAEKVINDMKNEKKE